MAITLLIICFVSVFLIVGLHTGPNLKEILLKSVLIFSAIIVFITEFTSFFHILNFQSILSFWIGISILNIFYLISKKQKLLSFIAIQKQHISKTFYDLNKFEKSLLFAVITILTFIFVQGIVYPPNNWDSMTYHMARIPNWISHQSVEHYPTHIFRQIYQPPFSGFVIMHFNILNCGDYFSNSVQFFFLVFSLFAILLIAERFELSRQHKLVAILLAVTIPEAILQASSTQNDIVISFFILTSVCFAAKALEEVNIKNYLYLGLSIGLGMLTKGTAYIYLAPILLILGIAVLIRLVKFNNYSYLWFSTITIVIILSINAGHFCRNYKLSNNILGVSKTESKMLSNQKMSPTLLISNIIKNAGLHMPPYPINKISNKVAYKLHTLIGVNIDDPDLNFASLKYRSPNMLNHEDSASNSIHFFLIFFSLILIGFSFRKSTKGFSPASLYLIMIIMQAMTFCLLLKWQPWHTRLHTPLFMLSIPLICYALNLKDIYFNLFKKLIPIIIFYAFFIILFNHSRPFITISHPLVAGKITSRISISDNRYKKYFSNRLALYEEYNSTLKIVRESNSKNIGLIIGGNDWEYALLSQFYGRSVNPIHINVSNISKNIPQNTNTIDCIISTTLNNKVIDYNGKRFYNLNSKNSVIWLYK